MVFVHSSLDCSKKDFPGVGISLKPRAVRMNSTVKVSWYHRLGIRLSVKVMKGAFFTLYTTSVLVSGIS